MRSVGATAVVALTLGSLLSSAPAGRAAAPAAAPLELSPYMDSVGPAVGGRQWTVNDYARSFANDEAMGVRWAYVWVSWSDIETAPGRYGWAGLDGLVASARQHRVQLMLQVQTAGDFVAPGPAQLAATGGTRLNSLHPMFPSAAPKHFEGPLQFWRALATRYRPDGDLARAMRWTDSYGVRWFEIENEPDSFAWPTGNWSSVPKDYALFVAAVKATLRSVSPELRTVGPALSTGPDGAGCCNGLSWLAQVLNTHSDASALQWASDDYRAAVKGGQPVVGAGPYLDAFSFHDDFYDPATSYSVDRADAMRKAIAGVAHPVLWETEGGPVETNTGLYARAQAQETVRLLAAGVQRINLDTAGARGDNPTALATDPIAREVKALTYAFPSALGVRARSAELRANAGQAIEAYSWTDPATGRTSWIVWAPNQARNSRKVGPPFEVRIPVHTGRARVIGTDWTAHDVTVTGGSVDVQLQSSDPSPVTFVVELP